MKQKILVLLFISCLHAGWVNSQSDKFEIEGWQTAGEPRTFERDNLWEYIDGAANRYLDYGFERLVSRELYGDSVTVVADVYDMGNPLNAFGIYSAERPSNLRRRALGTEAVLIPPYQALMVKGPFYVKVNVSEGRLGNQTACALLQKIAQILPGTSDYPREFSLLPVKDRRPYSFKYTKNNFSGLSELNSCISAEYQSEDYGPYTCFAVVGLEKEAMESIWTTVAAKWQKDTVAKTDVYFRKIFNNNYIGLIKNNSTITGVSDVKEKARLFEILEKIIK